MVKCRVVEEQVHHVFPLRKSLVIEVIEESLESQSMILFELYFISIPDFDIRRTLFLLLNKQQCIISAVDLI